MGVAFYHFRKSKVNDVHPLTKTAAEKNNENPTYDQMLKLDEKEFQQWLLIRNETDREKLLLEMIDHEEKTGSFRKSAKKEITGAGRALLDVFDIDKSARIVRTFGEVKEALTEGGKEGIDLVEDAIFAKAATDKVILNVGDMVLVRGKEKGQITEISVSNDGHKKYKVEFEGKSDKQEWFQSSDLVKLHS